LRAEEIAGIAVIADIARNRRKSGKQNRSTGKVSVSANFIWY
jgi:hypothetical protein